MEAGQNRAKTSHLKASIVEFLSESREENASHEMNLGFRKEDVKALSFKQRVISLVILFLGFPIVLGCIDPRERSLPDLLPSALGNGSPSMNGRRLSTASPPRRSSNPTPRSGNQTTAPSHEVPSTNSSATTENNASVIPDFTRANPYSSIPHCAFFQTLTDVLSQRGCSNRPALMKTYDIKLIHQGNATPDNTATRAFWMMALSRYVSSTTYNLPHTPLDCLSDARFGNTPIDSDSGNTYLLLLRSWGASNQVRYRASCGVSDLTLTSVDTGLTVRYASTNQPGVVMYTSSVEMSLNGSTLGSLIDEWSTNAARRTRGSTPPHVFEHFHNLLDMCRAPLTGGETHTLEITRLLAPAEATDLAMSSHLQSIMREFQTNTSAVNEFRLSPMELIRAACPQDRTHRHPPEGLNEPVSTSQPTPETGATAGDQ